MTEELYQTDSYLQEFDAVVTAADGQAITLDRTAFYPGGGGQPHDAGDADLAGRRGAGGAGQKAGRRDMAHPGRRRPAGRAPASTALLDWERRYQLMRTHTALHILCGVVWRDYGALVTGGNMEPLQGRMDFEFETMRKELVAEIEARVNAEIDKGHPVRVAILPREEAFQIPDLIRTKINLLPPQIARGAHRRDRRPRPAGRRRHPRGQHRARWGASGWWTTRARGRSTSASTSSWTESGAEVQPEYRFRDTEACSSPRDQTGRLSSNRSTRCSTSGSAPTPSRSCAAKNRGRERWSFIDGPITANNPMGVHHAWGRTYKDLFQRYWAMRGYDQRWQNGFDCQGLWVEVNVEKDHGLQDPRRTSKPTAWPSLSTCASSACCNYAAVQTEQSIRLGYWMDWNDPAAPALTWSDKMAEDPSQVDHRRRARTGR